jgi:hypothetical protein
MITDDDLFGRPRWIAGVMVLLLALAIGPTWYCGFDTVGYLSIARHVATEGRIAYLGEAHPFYSVGYPIFLSPLFALEEEPFLRISIVHLILALALFAGVYQWCRRVTPRYAVAITLIMFASVSYWSLYRRILSENLFCPLLIGQVLLLNRVHDRAKQGDGWLSALGAAGLQIVLVMVRPAGLMTAGGFGMLMLASLRRGKVSWRRGIAMTLVVGLPATAALALWVRHDRALAEESGFLTYSRALLETGLPIQEQFLEGLRLRIMEVGRLVLPGMLKAYAGQPGRWLDINIVVYGIVFVALGWGWLRLMRRGGDVFLWTLPFYFLLHFFWTYDQQTRFFLPLMPALLACFTPYLDAWPATWARRSLAAFILAHGLVTLGYWYFGDVRALQTQQMWEPEIRALAEELRPALPAKVAVSAAKRECTPLISYVLNNRRMVEYSATQPLADDVAWLIADPTEESPPGFATVREAGGFRLLKRRE